METSALKVFAQKARTLLNRTVKDKLSVVLAADSIARREQPAAVKKLETEIQEKGEAAVIEFVAYTWFNRFCALRYMDALDYTEVRVVSPYDGHTLPAILEDAKGGEFDDTLVANPEVQQRVSDLLCGRITSVDAQTEAYQLLFVSACNGYAGMMPFLFQKIKDYTELLLPDNLLAPGSILSLTREAMDEEACREGVEIIGWLYQFYISEKKDAVIGKTVATEDIPAATQLFTPHWIVRYLVENSLGRLWMLNHPTSSLADEMPYYIPPTEAETDFLRISSPEEIKICDPCCGSGHMLTYAFDLLVKIYEESGRTRSEIPGLILTNNLTGIEIDPRAGELAAFALIMKARATSTRFFRQRDNKIPQPNIVVLKNVAFDDIEYESYRAALGNDLFSESFMRVVRAFRHADCYGSLIDSGVDDVSDIERLLAEKEVASNMFLHATHQKVLTAIAHAKALSPCYHVVVTNPPYMGTKGMNSELKAFAADTFPSSKSDLFAMFIERCLDLVKPNGYSAMVTMQSWMFLSSYEALRKHLLETYTIECLCHMANMVMGIAFGTSSTVWKKAANPAYKGSYCFVEYEDIVENKPVAFPPKNKRNPTSGHFYETATDNFSKIPGSPIAYWVSEKAFHVFDISKEFENYAKTRAGMITGNNNLFIRLWHEVGYNKIGLRMVSRDKAIESKMKWFPYNKGGDYRKWYGNNEYVVNWENDGFFMRNYTDSTGKIPAHAFNLKYIFKQNITWSSLSSYKFSARYSDYGFLYDASGSFVDISEKDIYYALAFLCSEATMFYLSAMNPTLNFQKGNISSLPFIKDEDKKSQVEILAQQNIAHSRDDWDAFETSWDFKCHPLVRLAKKHKEG